MNSADVVSALSLPADARVDQRVPKKLLIEQGQPTASDKRQIQEGLEELRWIAALKPGNIGVPAYRDAVREYLEIAVLTMALRDSAKVARLVEMVHRAIPYPVLLVSAHGTIVEVSLTHKRFSQSQAEATVVDGDLVSASLDGSPLSGFAVELQPRTNLFALYQGWIEWVEAIRAFQITGRLARGASPEAAAARREALERHDQLRKEIASLRAQATAELQINRRVELNLTIRRLEAELAQAFDNL